MPTIKVYGDGVILPHLPVIVFPKQGILCDISDYGIYVCGEITKTLGETPETMKWIEAIKLLELIFGEDTEIEYHGEIMPRHKYLRDLVKYLIESP